jgi:hypothetical protein
MSMRFSLALVCLSLGCVGTPIYASADWERGADLSPSKTFSVVRSPRLPKLKPEQEALVQLVETTAKRELIEKGYKEAPADAAQLIAMPYFLTRERAEVTVLSYNCAQSTYASAGNILPDDALPPCEESTISEVEEGVLIIDVYDSKRKELVWHGWATAKRPEPGTHASPDRVAQATRDILEKFPP